MGPLAGSAPKLRPTTGRYAVAHTFKAIMMGPTMARIPSVCARARRFAPGADGWTGGQLPASIAVLDAMHSGRSRSIWRDVYAQNLGKVYLVLLHTA